MNYEVENIVLTVSRLNSNWANRKSEEHGNLSSLDES